MKKQLLSTLLLGLGLSVMAVDTPTTQWGNLIDGTTSAGDQAISVTVGKSGDVYWYGIYGTTTAAPDINYAGELLYKGAEYAGTSNNGNFTLLKTNTEGEKTWVVYSNSGDFATSGGGAAATPDGGTVVVSKVRHTDGMTDKNINLVDATGKSTAIEWTCETRYYRMMVNKVSEAGAIEWTRMIDFSTVAADGESFLSDVFNLGSVTTDDSGNIYIGLNYRSAMTLAKADNTTITLEPKNITDWDGKTSTAAGDFLLLGLDSDGYYRNALTLDGSATAAYCQALTYNEGKVYSQGYIIGNGSDLTVQGKTLKPSDVMSPVLVAMDTDFKVEWAKCFPAEKVDNKNALQNCGMAVLDGSLFFVGQYNLKFSDPDDSSKTVYSTQGTLREGFIVKLNAATGEWIVARDSRDDQWGEKQPLAMTTLLGYLAVIPCNEVKNAIYIAGYTMNANVGVFLRRYDATTLVGDVEAAYDLVTGGGSPTLQAICYDNAKSALYICTRGNNIFNMLGAGESEKPSGWGILADKVAMPEAQETSVENISVELNQPVEYFNLQGIRVDNPQNGIYIRRQGNTAVKVIK